MKKSTFIFLVFLRVVQNHNYFRLVLKNWYHSILTASHNFSVSNKNAVCTYFTVRYMGSFEGIGDAFF